MNSKWKNDLIKSSCTLGFIFLSYYLASKINLFSYIPIIKNSLPKKALFSMAVAIYTAILNFIMFTYLSYRSQISIKILDKKDESDTIKIIDKPRTIVVKIEISNSLINKGYVIIRFPKWVDVMKSNDPYIKTITTSKFKYSFEEGTTKIYPTFDITLSERHSISEKEGEISAKFHGNKVKYEVTIANLKVHNKGDS